MFLQLILHWFGDYISQSDWMALNKTKNNLPCFIHCILYTIPFYIFLSHGVGTWGGLTLITIFWSHFFIDRYSLAKYIIWFKNHLNPSFTYEKLEDCNVTGYYDVDAYQLKPPYTSARPRFITIWLYIITDNGLHILCNYLAFKYL